MADLFLPPMTPTTPNNQFSSTNGNVDNNVDPPLQKYTRYDVSEADDPTLAWVGSLPSPVNRSFINSDVTRPDSRCLETPFLPLHGLEDMPRISQNPDEPVSSNVNVKEKIGKNEMLQEVRSPRDQTENNLLPQNAESENQQTTGKHLVKKNVMDNKEQSITKDCDVFTNDPNDPSIRQREIGDVHDDLLEDVLALASRDTGIENCLIPFGSIPTSPEVNEPNQFQSVLDINDWEFVESLQYNDAEQGEAPGQGDIAEFRCHAGTSQQQEAFQPVSQGNTTKLSEEPNFQLESYSVNQSNSQSIQIATIAGLKGPSTEQKNQSDANGRIIVIEDDENDVSIRDSRKRKLSQDNGLEQKHVLEDDVVPTTPVRNYTPVVIMTPVSQTHEEDGRAASVGSSICSGMTNDMAIARESKLPDKKLMGDIVQRYLRKREEMRVVILHAKVAQKSYGSEKRFFCPPPCVHLLGCGWKTKQRRKAASSSAQSPLPSPGGGSTSALSASEVCLFMGVGGGDNDLQQVQLELPHRNYAAAKTLHTPDSDKRKNFEIHVKMFYGDGSEIGLFHSQRIKVISKPSKKKQSVKNTDPTSNGQNSVQHHNWVASKNISLSTSGTGPSNNGSIPSQICIASGSKVALFNRLRSQTVSTRYLHVTKDGYKASASQWGSFAIHLLDSTQPEGEVFEVEDGYIHYGTTVKLVCSITGYTLPRLIIRKVDKQMAVINSDEPVSQLHKCALHLKDTDRQYLCLSQEKIIVYKATPHPKDPELDRLTDGACWTIISTDKSEYRWSDSAFNLVNNVAVTPVPVVKNLEINGSGDMALAEITGENFTPNLTIWFAHVETDTMFRCNECMVCMIPEINKFKSKWKYVKKTVKVPLLLVRDDGVIYPCGVNFYYTPERKVKKSAEQLSLKQILKQRPFQ